jgi:hypothetical protein
MLLEFDNESDTITIKYKDKLYEVTICLDGTLQLTDLDG